MKKSLATLAVLLCAISFPALAQNTPTTQTMASVPVSKMNYKSFVVSTYIIQSTTQQLMNSSDAQLETAYANLTRNLKLDKIYIEVMRNHTLVNEAGLDRLKKFFESKGLVVCGGLAYSVSESYGFQSFDYADPENREFARQSVEMAARHFDEVLLDDYYFFNRKTEAGIKAKGDKSWTQYRLEAMRDVTENLIVKPAKAVNPKCKVVIKMANWYDQYASMGNDTEKVPFIADGMFSGTESRNWVGQEQHLQPYLSYNIMRFMDNRRPGINMGGWVDQGGANPIDRYAEQVLNTVFSKAPEMCCFHWGGMLGAVREGNRPWADQPTSLNMSEVAKTVPQGANPLFADVAAYTLKNVDKALAVCGKPMGIKAYSPFHATGEEFIHDFFGMIGLPMEIVPQWPTDESMVIVSEKGKFDADIIKKIKGNLMAGKNVCVTSGFVAAMKGKGIEDIAEIENTGKTVAVKRFTFSNTPGAPRGGARGARGGAVDGAPDPNAAPRDILIPEIYYPYILTHDAWGDAMGVTAGGLTYPMLISCDYGNGKLYVLTVPNDPSDFYALPPSLLSVLRANIGGAEPVRLDTAPAQVALFRYDNNAFIVQNYQNTPAEVTVSVAGNVASIREVVTEKSFTPAAAAGGMGGRMGMGGMGGGGGGGARRGGAAPAPRTTFTFTVLPHSYMAFQPK